jgi:hypothetical protein
MDNQNCLRIVSLAELLGRHGGQNHGYCKRGGRDIETLQSSTVTSLDLAQSGLRRHNGRLDAVHALAEALKAGLDCAQ